LRALTAARLYSGGGITTLTKAAEACGSNVPYVQAAVVLLKAENETLLRRVLSGDIPVLVAASQAKRMADLVFAYRAASENDRVAFARTCGPEALLDVLATAAS
jgi:shikimate kinase